MHKLRQTFLAFAALAFIGGGSAIAVQTVNDFFQATGYITANAPSPRNIATCGTAAQLAADGNDSTPASTSVYVAEVFVPYRTTVTGIAALNGSAGTDARTVSLYKVVGTVGTKIAQSATTAAGTNDAYQRIAFTAPIVIDTGVYYVGIAFASTTARFNTFAVGSCGAGEITGQVYANGPPTTITPPTTFTTALGPIASLY